MTVVQVVGMVNGSAGMMLCKVLRSSHGNKQICPWQAQRAARACLGPTLYKTQWKQSLAGPFVSSKPQHL